ncbi:choice-of-anchor D domain-containing protein [Brevifollis gellanilyticus]|uniref:Ig-like domain-containing protein n=1 Tax=Brevifollis gellanilyticus TaxID=748831 RepID=A0A512M2Z4_9BACT|nr:choice-of-anchor D domain-containing protein [Brevifollis gellanilyticus]GEP41115.1 hypothetical protein BGE01nite_04060 [Brevifollis gellanilyticus]
MRSRPLFLLVLTAVTLISFFAGWTKPSQPVTASYTPSEQLGPPLTKPVLASPEQKHSATDKGASHPVPPESEKNSAQIAGNSQTALNTLPKTEQESLWAALGSARRAVQPLTDHEASLPQNKGVRYFAQNPAQHLTMRFLDGSVRIESGRGGKWAATLGLDTRTRPQPNLTNDRVEYHHANGITEWYENRADGIEHAFKVARCPDSTSGELRVPVSLQGVQARTGEGPRTCSLTFTDTISGAPVLSYGALKVWDAQGKELAAHYETKPQGVDIVVADAGAVYPVTIDPLVGSIEAELLPPITGMGWGGTPLGQVVALSENTAIFGMENDTTVAGLATGSAYVFVRNGTAWTLQARLIADDAAYSEYFGSSVALQGDTALIGANRFGDWAPGSAYIFIRNGTTWTQQAKFTGDLDRGLFGSSVALADNTAVVGAYGEDMYKGATYIFVRSGTTWTRQAKLTANDGEEDNNFGACVALSGNTVLVGAPADDSYRGSAYAFVRSGTTWTQQTKFTAASRAMNSYFGGALAISGDTALIGAPQDASFKGSVHIFVRSGSTWSFQTQLAPTPGILTFGRAVALSGDMAWVAASNTVYVFNRSGTSWTSNATLNLTGRGMGGNMGGYLAASTNTLLIGAAYASTEAGPGAGSAYVFTRNGSAWNEEASISLGDNSSDNTFGTSLVMSGEMAVIGAQQDSTAAGSRTGSVHVMVRNGTTWTRQAMLNADDASEGLEFGNAVAISGDSIIVGACWADLTIGWLRQGAGCAYVFTRTGTTWSQQAKLIASDASDDDLFGSSVAISGDTALIGAERGDVNSTGTAYVFVRNGSVWSQQTRLMSNSSTPYSGFGHTVALFSPDVALVGRSHEDTPAGTRTGCVYMFTRSGSTWGLNGKITASDAAANDYFGGLIALSDNTLLISAGGDQGVGSLCDGSVYVFVHNGALWTEQAKLNVAKDPRNSYFGGALAISGDIAVVGNSSYDLGDLSVAGIVRVFTREGSIWTQQPSLNPDVPLEWSYFGASVAVSGNTVMAGRPYEDLPASSSQNASSNRGSVFVFRLASPRPKISLSGNGRTIATGDTTPSSSDDTHFGLTPVGSGLVTHTFTITNPGTGELALTGTPYVSVEGSNAFRVMQQPASGTLPPGGTQTFQLRFYPTTGGAHTAVVKISSNDEEVSALTMTVSGGRAVAPSIITQPLSQLVPLGAPASLSVVAGGYPTPPVQWKKDVTMILGAIHNPFVIPVTKAADVGIYSVVVAPYSASPPTSESVYLGLVTQSPGTQVLKTGGALKLACTAIAPKTPGVKLTYRWQRGEAALSDGTMINGAVVKGAADTVLTLTKIGVEDAGIYTCLVTMETPGIPATHANAPKTTNGNTTVHVVGGVPDVDAIPAATISVSQPVNMTITATNFPTGFSVSGLPAGLKFDGKTGRLTGKPTSPSKKDKNGAYTPNKLSFKASNPVGTSTAEDFYLTIQELDPGAIGTFNGIVARSAHSNFGMGGHLQITVASTGIVSGSATLAGQKHSILGSLDASTDSDPTGELIIKRSPASLGDLKLTLSIDTEKDLLQGTIEDPQFKMLEGSIDLGDPNEPGLMDGAVDAARFDSPSGIALRPDASGYIADTGNHVIRLVNSVTQEVSTYAGSGVVGFVDGDGEAASFNSPEGLALDTAGNLYVADTGNATIRKISPAGTVTTFAGTAGQFGSTDGIGTSARFSQPCALCLDPAGNLYVADRGNHLIRKITPTSVVTTLAGKANAPGHKDGSGAGAQFKAPGGITYDPLLKALFVADTQNRVIRKVTLAGATTTYAGSPGVSGDDDGLFANVRFMAPVGITSLGDGRLVVADTLLVQLNPNGTAGTVSESLPGLNQTGHPVALACNANEQSLIVVHDTLHAVFGYEPGEPLGDGLVEARRNTWSNASLVPPQLQGAYNAAIETTAAVGDVEYPQGDGYAQVSVDKMGVAKWTGVAADGSTFTFSTFMAANHSIPLHAMLYKNTGSLQGECLVNDTTLDIINVSTLAFDWNKIAQPLASTDRSYKTGFLRHALHLRGGKYTPNNVFGYLGLAGASANMQLTFSASRIPQFLQPFILTAPNTVSVGSPVNSLTLKLDPKTGTFTGSFKESTAGVTVPFAGMLIDYEAGPVRRGHGHYLIPDSASNTSPIQSQRVRLERVVAP